MIVFVKKVRELIITHFGYIHPIKLLYLLDTLHRIFRCLGVLGLYMDVDRLRPLSQVPSHVQVKRTVRYKFSGNSFAVLK